MENNDTLEVIQRIPLDKLRPYPDHPFGVRDDDMMQQTVESIKQFGVLVTSSIVLNSGLPGLILNIIARALNRCMISPTSSS